MISITLITKPDPGTQSLLDWIKEALEIIMEKVTAMALDIARLQREVSENNNAIQSAVTLIEQISQALREAAGNQDAVNALADQLDAQSNALAAAVAANTPAEPVG